MHQIPDNTAMTTAMHFWMGLWQKQIEQNMKVWALWGQMIPRETSKQISAEVEAMKAANRP